MLFYMEILQISKLITLVLRNTYYKLKIMKKFNSLLFLLSVIFVTQAQEYQLEADQFEGEIILKNGEVRKGYIDLKGGDMTPWATQQSVKFFSEEATKDGKVKGKEMEKFKPKDLKGFRAGDRYFEVLKVSASKFTTGMGIPQNKFVECLVEGKIKLYKLYEAPDPAAVNIGEEAIAAYEAELERMRNEPVMLVSKDGGKLTPVGKVDLADFLKDCKSVQEKYTSGGYGVEPVNPDAKTKLGKMIANKANSVYADGVLEEILGDYNACEQ